MGKADITRTESEIKPMNLCFIDENTYPTAKGEWEKAATRFMLIPKVVRDQAGNPVDTEPLLRLLPGADQDDKPHNQYRLGTGNQAMVAHVGAFQNTYSLGLSFIDYKDEAEDPFFRENPHCSTPARYLLDRLTVESQRNPALLRFHNPAEKRMAAIRFAMTKYVPVVIVSGGSVYGPKGEVKTRPTPAILQLSNQAYTSLMKVLCNQRVNWSGYWNPEDMDKRETLVQRFDMDAGDLRNPSMLFSLETKEARSGESGFGWDVSELGPQRRTYLYGDAAASLRFAADWGIMPENFMRFMSAREQVETLFGYSADIEWTNAMFTLFAGSPYAQLFAGKEGEFIAAAEQNAGILAARTSKGQQGGAFGPQYGQQQYGPQQQYGQPQGGFAPQQNYQQGQPQGAFAQQQPPAYTPPPTQQAAPAQAPLTAPEQVPYQTPFTPPPPAHAHAPAPGGLALSGYGQPPAHQAAGAHAHVPPGHHSHAPQPPAGATAPVAPDVFAPVAGGVDDEIPFDPASTALQGVGDTAAVLNGFRAAVN